MRWRWLVGGGAALALIGAEACNDSETTPVETRCPNEQPTEGGACSGDLVCNYAEPTTCEKFYTATCVDGKWQVDRPCLESGGAGPTGGGDGGMGGGVGAHGGGGSGAGGCADPVEGPPEVTSTTTLIVAPDGGFGLYPLIFNETVATVSDKVSWQGPGAIEQVIREGSTYEVHYVGMLPGDSATLTIDGVEDLCGNVLAAPVTIDITHRASCHLLDESFEGDFIAAGFSTVDHASDGNQWLRSDLADMGNGVENHTSGAGFCATTNDIGSGGTQWDAELRAPPVDLTMHTHAVARFASHLSDPPGSGTAFIEGSQNGTSWTPLATWVQSRDAFEAIDLSDFSGGLAHVRWRYVNAGGLGSWWDIDDACIETYTKASCPCPANGIMEVDDLDGFMDMNGNPTIAEDTLVTLATLNQEMVVCGLLEDDDASGADFFEFAVASGTGAAVNTKVSYCIENGLQDATATVLAKTIATPLATESAARNKDSIHVDLVDNDDHYIALSAPDGFAPSRYTVRFKVENLANPLINESFEVWPPMDFTITDDDGCLDWQQASETVVPFGELPTDGSFLAYFNSYDCNSGSESLVSAPLDFTNLTSIVLSLDMYHDTEFPNAFDNIQVEYFDSLVMMDWVPIGLPIERPRAVDGWETHMVDLTFLANEQNVTIRLLTTTQFGNNLHIDNVKLLSQGP